MVKAQINIDGTKIVIEGSEEEVKNIVDYVSNRKILGEEHKKNKKLIISSKPSISDQIDELKEEGFFNEPKALIDIKTALAEKGMIYPVTTLSGKLIKKVRKRELGRIRTDKKWSYVKR